MFFYLCQYVSLWAQKIGEKLDISGWYFSCNDHILLNSEINSNFQSVITILHLFYTLTAGTNLVSLLCDSDVNLNSRDRHVLQLQQHTTTSHLIQNTRQSEEKKTFNNRLNSLHNTCCNRLQVFPFIIFILTYLYRGAVVRQFFIRHVEKHFQPSYENLLSLLLESPSAFGTRPCLHFERHGNISSISLRKLK